MRVVVVLLAVAACGDNIEPDPNVARSGSRLKLISYDYGAGTRQLERAWFHDGHRGERCTPRMWSDGVTICTPDSTDTVFPTSECTRALGRVPAGRAVPPYFIRDYYLADAWVPSRIFVPGERAETPAQGWELRDGACLGPYDTAGFDYYEVGRELPRAGFARITHPEATTTSRLALTSVASEDGLYAPIGLVDRDLEARCIPDASPGADETRCVPDGVATAEYFNDAACSQPELALAFGDAFPKLIRHQDARSACTSYHAIGLEVDAPPLYHRNGPSCVSIAAPTSNRYLLAGAPRELGRLARDRDPAARRIHPIELAHGDLRIADELLYDETLATECRRGEIEGAMYCLPATSVAIVERFADDTCVATIPLAEVPTGTCASPATFALTATRTIHAIGALHTTPLYHLSTGDRCLPYASPEGIALHDVGPALDLRVCGGDGRGRSLGDRPLDREAGRARHGGQLLDSDPRHARRRGPVLAPGQKLCDALGSPFGLELDRAIRAIPHPARESEALRLVGRRHAIRDTLNTAGHDRSYASHACPVSHIAILRPRPIKRFSYLVA